MKGNAIGFMFGASGSLANAICASKWNGQQYLRSVVTPKNRKSEDQGDSRLFLGAAGRAAGKVNPGSDYAVQMDTLGRIPSGQSKQSALVKFIRDQYFDDATGYEAEVTAYEAHSAKAGFDSAAAGIGLMELAIDYCPEARSPASAGLMLYILARAAIAYEFTGSPYDTALADWTSDEVDEMVADMALPA